MWGRGIYRGGRTPLQGISSDGVLVMLLSGTRRSCPHRSYATLRAAKGHVRTLRKSVVLPHSLERVSGVVADVSRYEEFLPYCTSSYVVRHRDGHDKDAKDRGDDDRNPSTSFECVLGFKHTAYLNEEIRHRVRVSGPRKDRVEAETEESTHCYAVKYDWRFEEIDRNITKATLDLHLDLKTMLHAMTFDVMREAVETTVFDAFMKRIDEEEGERAGS